jgi:endonuclease III
MANQRVEVEKERRRVDEVLRRLEEHFPVATCALLHENAYQLLVATILSAQCTDQRVNLVTPELFRRYPDPATLAGADPGELQDVIRSTGFFRNKARNLIAAATAISRDFRGEVPRRMEDLLSLPGVARKTANVVLGTWFGVADGVVVDTHVSRLSRRLGLTEESDPSRIERDLMARIPSRGWIDFSHRLIHHGRRTCKAQRPRCAECFLAEVCPSAEVGEAAGR